MFNALLLPLLLVFLAALVWWMLRRFSGPGQTPAPPQPAAATPRGPDTVPAAPPGPSPVADDAYTWPRDTGVQVGVVGERLHAAHLAALLGDMRQVDGRLEAAATLWPDAGPAPEAGVAVWIGGAPIGQLGRDDALEFRRALERLGRPGQPSRCVAVVFGRHGQNGQADYRVVLDIDFFAEA